MDGEYRYIRLSEFCHWLARGWAFAALEPMAPEHHGRYSVIMRGPE